MEVGIEGRISHLIIRALGSCRNARNCVLKPLHIPQHCFSAPLQGACGREGETVHLPRGYESIMQLEVCLPSGHIHMCAITPQSLYMCNEYQREKTR